MDPPGLPGINRRHCTRREISARGPQLRVARASHPPSEGKRPTSEKRAARPRLPSSAPWRGRARPSLEPNASRQARIHRSGGSPSSRIAASARRAPRSFPEPRAAVIPSPTTGGQTARASPARRAPSSGRSWRPSVKRATAPVRSTSAIQRRVRQPLAAGFPRERADARLSGLEGRHTYIPASIEEEQLHVRLPGDGASGSLSSPATTSRAARGSRGGRWPGRGGGPR